MLQKFKNVFLCLLFLGMAFMLWEQKRQIEVLKDTNESIIDSLRSVVVKEESLVDSFSVVRISIKEKKDSSFSVIDTAGIISLTEILKRNIYEYAKNDTLGPLTIVPGI